MSGDGAQSTETERRMVVWLVEVIHYPFDLSFATPPPVDHDLIADHWNEWDGWGVSDEEARSLVRDEAGLLDDDEPDGAPCCQDPDCGGSPCTFPGYAANH